MSLSRLTNISQSIQISALGQREAPSDGLLQPQSVLHFGDIRLPIQRVPGDAEDLLDIHQLRAAMEVLRERDLCEVSKWDTDQAA